MTGAGVITDKTVDAVLDALEKKGYDLSDLAKPTPDEARFLLRYRHYTVTFTVAVELLPEGEGGPRCTCETCTCGAEEPGKPHRRARKRGGA